MSTKPTSNECLLVPVIRVQTCSAEKDNKHTIKSRLHSKDVARRENFQDQTREFHPQ